MIEEDEKKALIACLIGVLRNNGVIFYDAHVLRATAQMIRNMNLHCQGLEARATDSELVGVYTEAISVLLEEYRTVLLALQKGQQS